MEVKTIHEYLHKCTVKLDCDKSVGTGFFIAPGLILTCTHVVVNCNGIINVRWQKKHDFAKAEIMFFDVNSDIALLKFNLPVGIDLPYIIIDDDEDVKPGDDLYTFGFPGGSRGKEYDGGGETFKYECVGIPDNLFIKFKFDEAPKGISGSPLLNQRTGKVCGMVKRQAKQGFLGGDAIRASIILLKLSEEKIELPKKNHPIYDLLYNKFQKDKLIGTKKITSYQKRIFNRFGKYYNFLDLPERLEKPYVDTKFKKQNNYYVARKNIIDQLVNGLKKTGPKTYEIIGLGGIGKTELVKQVIHKLQSGNFLSKGVLWIDLSIHFDDTSHLLSYIGEQYYIYGLLNVGSIDTQLELLKFALYNYDSLIILDSAENQDVLQIAYRALADKNIVITSRNKTYLSTDKTFYLEDLKPEIEGVNLFKNIVNSINPQLIGNNDFDTLANIAKRLSGHPMSIEIIALKSAYENWSPHMTLEKIREFGIDLIDIQKDTVTYLDERHRSLEMTFSLALNNFAGSPLFNYRINALLIICSTLAGEFFFKDEIFVVLDKYWQTYNVEKESISKTGDSQKNILKENSVRTFLEKVTLVEDNKTSASYINEVHFQNESFKGYKEINYFLTHPEEVDKILHILISVGILKCDDIDNERKRYHIHPLVRDYASKNLGKYFTKKLWISIAEWHKEKAIKIDTTEGEQLRNLLFFLHVCREQNLMEQYWDILFSIIGYIRKKGMWIHELEYLKLGLDWFEKDYQNDYALGIFNMKLGAFFAVVLKEKAISREHLEKSLKHFKKLQDNYNLCWVSYWLNNSFFNNLSTKLLEKKFDNIRICMQKGYGDICAAEFEDLLVLIDPIKNEKEFLEIQVSTISFHLKNSSYSDLIRCLTQLSKNQRLIGNLDLAEKSINIAENLLKSFYEITLEYLVLKEKFFLKVSSITSFDETEKILNTINNLVEKIGFQNNLLNDVGYIADLKYRQDTPLTFVGNTAIQLCKCDYEYMRGILCLEKKDYSNAMIFFDQAIQKFDYIDDDNSYLASLYPLLFLSVFLSETKDIFYLEKQYERMENAFENTHKLIEKHFIRGIIAAYYNIVKNKKNMNIIDSFNQSLFFLKTNGAYQYKWLKLLKSHLSYSPEIHENDNLILKIDEDEDFNHISNLPKLVKSKKDNRIMKLVPSGLCPIFINNKIYYTWCKAYYIDVHPVTVGDYVKFLEETEYNMPADWNEQFPSEDYYHLLMWGISHNDAESYMNWAKKKLPNIYELLRITMLERDSRYNLSNKSDFLYQIEQYLADIPVSFSKIKKENIKFNQKSKTNIKRLESLKWNEGLPNDITALSFLKLDSGNEEVFKNFLDLLSTSISYSIFEKEDIINDIVQISEQEFEVIMIFLSEEEKFLSDLDCSLNIEIEKLKLFRWKQWKNYVFKKYGFNQPYQLSKDSQEIYNSMSAYDYAPPFSRYFPDDYSFEKSLSKELNDAERRAVLRFMQYLSTSIKFTPDEKIQIISTLDDGIDSDLNGLSIKLDFERVNYFKDKRLTESLVVLQKVWNDWKKISNFFISIHANSKTLFQNKSNLLKKINVEDHPYFSIDKWNENLPSEDKEYSIINQNKLDLHDDLLLDFLSGSISLTIEEKNIVIDKVEELTQDQINELLWILAEERRQFRELDPIHWSEIRNMVGSAKQQWSSLVQEKLFQKNNPYKVLHHWKRFVSKEYNIRELIPELPINSYKENYLLSLLACSIFIGKKQKKQLISNLPKWNKNDLLNLINLLKEHYIYLQKTDSSLWPVLWQWFGKIYEEWDWVLKELTTENKKGNPLRNRCVWELPYSSISKINKFIEKDILENEDILILLNILSYSISLTIEDKKEIFQNFKDFSSEDIYIITQKLYYEFYTFINLKEDLYFWLSGQILKAEKDWFLLTDELFCIKENEYIKTGFTLSDVIDVEKKINLTLVNSERKNDYNKFRFNFSFHDDFYKNIFGNPETLKRPCDTSLPDFFDIRCIIEDHPNTNFSELYFLELLSGSISLTKDEKLKVIKAIPNLTQKQIDSLLSILLAEKWSFLSLDKSHWLQLRFLKEIHWELWDKLIIEHLLDFFRGEIDKTVQFKNKINTVHRRNDINFNHHDLSVLKFKEHLPYNHPYQKEPDFYQICKTITDIRDIIPDHFETYFPEREFLQLLGASLYLNLQEKKNVILSIPNLSQSQMDELIKILSNERWKYSELNPEHWNELNRLFINSWEEWLNELYTHPIFNEYRTVDKRSYEYSFLSEIIWHWSSNEYYENEKRYAIASGGPRIDDYLPDSKPIENYSTIVLDSSVAYNVVAFRGCIPIYSSQDIEGLDEISESGDII